MTNEVSATIGWITVIGAIICWGSNAVPLKIKSVQRAQVDPLVFQLYQSSAIFLSCWLLLTYNKFQFTYFGLIGAGRWLVMSG